MRLSCVEISEFQSIRYSNRFDIGDITCLVGKNEAGKTAILRALYRLNPIIPAHSNFDVTGNSFEKGCLVVVRDVTLGSTDIGVYPRRAIGTMP